jgi:hypothetical protein
MRDRIKFENTHNSWLSASLSPKDIDILESTREKDIEKSMKLRFDFEVKYTELQNYDNDRITIRTLSKYFEQEHIIKQSDWINKFAPHLGIGNFILVELQIPEKHIASKRWEKVYTLLLEHANEMKNSIRKGEWKQVMLEARQFSENLKFDETKPGPKKDKEALEKLFVDDDHSSDGFKKLYDCIRSFFDYCSKFMHDKNQQGQHHAIPVAEKEDAYFAYAMAVGILNMIGKKMVNK